jgi:hypothetical protein
VEWPRRSIKVPKHGKPRHFSRIPAHIFKRRRPFLNSKAISQNHGSPRHKKIRFCLPWAKVGSRWCVEGEASGARREFCCRLAYCWGPKTNHKAKEALVISVNHWRTTHERAATLVRNNKAPTHAKIRPPILIFVKGQRDLIYSALTKHWNSEICITLCLWNSWEFWKVLTAR